MLGISPSALGHTVRNLEAKLDSYPDIRVEFVLDSRFIDIAANGFDAGIRLHDDVPRDRIAIRFQPDMVLAAVASPHICSGVPLRESRTNSHSIAASASVSKAAHSFRGN